MGFRLYSHVFIITTRTDHQQILIYTYWIHFKAQKNKRTVYFIHGK